MAGLLLKDINKTYENGSNAVKNINLQVKDKEFLVLVGPSGCGKSTILRMIAGLEEITTGELYIDDVLVNEVEPKDRDIAMVFQNYALYPHMTVYENMAFGLKIKKTSKDEIDKRVNWASEILGIKEFLKRKPKQLSGGQRQRVALGRAIVRNPKVFLMDEPLSNLDAKLRVQTRSEIIKLHKKLNTTFIYVTHDQTEAMTMGTRIVVIKDGVIQQVDTPQNIYNKPANKFVASFIGSPQMNFLNGVILEENEEILIKIKDSIIKIEKNKQNILKENGYINKNITVGIRAENIKLQEETNMKPIEGKVDVIEYLGSENYVYIASNVGNLVMKTSAEDKMNIEDVKNIYFELDNLYLFNEETEERISFKA